jgi:protein-S-isoprenylcysteine O-methyltransferase Ste14
MLRTIVGIVWVVFWLYWLVSAAAAKESVEGGPRVRITGIGAVGTIAIVAVFRGALATHNTALEVVGTVLFACGLALAVWARLHLGRNWGTPTSQRVEPELITSGPYRFVRHPIYSGLLLALAGTALVDSLYALIVVAVLVAYFYYCGRVEERNLTAAFPDDYPAYRRRTKMLIPFIL